MALEPDPTTPTRWSVDFTGQGSELFALTLVNALLNLITLGIWFAWGRVKELRYLIGSTRVDGDPMSFHGHGMELFRGVLIAFFLVIVPLYVALILSAAQPGVGAVIGALAIYLGFGLFIVFVSVGSLRYRLPRTSWRGIRFGFDGKPLEFVGRFTGRGLLVLLSLGFYYPIYACWRRSWILSHTRFGTESFACDAEPEPLYGKFILCWFLAVPTLGLASLWYQGYQQAHLWNHTRIGHSRFTTTMTGGGWLKLMVVNALLQLVTLGLATPSTIVRTHRYLLSSLSLDGGLDLAAIRQRLQESGGFAEGALDALDFDSGLDLG